MFNSLYETPQGQLHCSKISKNFNPSSKLTVFTVYKMMEEKPKSCQNKKQVAKRENSNQRRPKLTISYVAQQKDLPTYTKYDKFRGKLEEFRKNIHKNVSKNMSQSLSASTQKKKASLIGQTINKEKVNQRRLLNQTMKIMKNHIYSVNIPQNNSRNVQSNQSDNEEQKYQQRGLNIKLHKRQDQFAKRKNIKDKFRRNIKRLNTGSQNSLIGQVIQSSNQSQEITGASTECGFVKVKQLFNSESIQDSNSKYMLCKRYSLSEIHQKVSKQKLSLYQIQIIKMGRCLDIFLNSFHCALQNDSSKFRASLTTLGWPHQKASALNCNEIKVEQPSEYYYYIGYGNNNGLVRSIFRKRGWWTETNSIQKAHVVWTQLKVKQVLEKMPKCKKQDRDIQMYLEEQINVQNKNDLFQGQKKKAYRKLFHEKHDYKYYEIHSQKWNNLRLLKIKIPTVLHNHLQCNYMLGNKNRLFLNIKVYYQYLKKDLETIIPPTYYLQQSNSALFQSFQQKFMANTNNIWIVKPGENSNRGQKIILTTNLQQIKSKLVTENKLIVQKYMKNLLLYQGRKFDIRTYLLAININGRLKFYFYEQGYLRTSSQMFTTDNIKDRYVHLTNDAVQQQSCHYGKYEEGNKISYSQFQRFLINKYQRHNYGVDKLHEQMKTLCKNAVMATYMQLNPNKKEFGFELFGLDYIIDSHFRPLLIEVNTNPCLELPSHSLERLIPRMMENIFRLSIDPLFRPTLTPTSKIESYYLYDQSFLRKNQFCLIFDERFDHDLKWEQYLGGNNQFSCVPDQQ